MLYGISKGHNTAYNQGAVGNGYKEDDLTKLVGDNIIDGLKALNEEVIDCTPTTATSLTDSLKRRCDIANQNSVDLYIELHLNANYNPSANGTEVYCNPKNITSSSYASRIVKGLSNLGWNNRGIKDGNWLYVIKNTNMSAILVEICFISNANDMAIFDSDKVANAIVFALTGKEIPSTNVETINKYYIVTNYLPVVSDQYKAVKINPILNKYFVGVETYILKNDKGMWIETEYIPKEKAYEIHELLKVDNLHWEVVIE